MTERLLSQQSWRSSDRPAPDDSVSDHEDDDPDDTPEPVKILQSTATFDEITIWGHDMLPTADDPFVKGVEEWVAFAEAIHVQPPALESHITVIARVQAGS